MSTDKLVLHFVRLKPERDLLGFCVITTIISRSNCIEEDGKWIYGFKFISNKGLKSVACICILLYSDLLNEILLNTFRSNIINK